MEWMLVWTWIDFGVNCQILYALLLLLTSVIINKRRKCILTWIKRNLPQGVIIKKRGKDSGGC